MRKSRNRSLFLGIVLFLILMGVVGRLLFPRYGNLLNELPEGNFTAAELFQEFTCDPTNAYIRLAGKTIILEGEIAATGDGYVVMGKDLCTVRCMLRKSIYDREQGLKTGYRVTLKGVCRGLNMTEVLVTHCIILYNRAN